MLLHKTDTFEKYVQPTGKLSQQLTEKKSFPNGKNAPAIFIKTVQHATLRATYRNLTVSLRSFSLSLTSAVIPVKLPPTQKHLQKIKSACWCVVCRAFTCLTDTEGEGKGTGEEEERQRERQLVTKLLDIDHDRFLGFCIESKHRSAKGSVTHSCISKNGGRSLLLANNSSSCSQAVSLYEKIWENDAVCVYCDLVWRRNPIKMMKKPHRRTSQGWAGWQSIQWSEGRGSTGRGK